MSGKTFPFTSTFLFKSISNLKCIYFNLKKSNKRGSVWCLSGMLYYQVYDMKMKSEFQSTSIVIANYQSVFVSSHYNLFKTTGFRI